MANWYYYDKNGTKVGPVDSEGMKRLAGTGMITPETIIETEKGRQSTAGKIQGLAFLPSLNDHVSYNEPLEFNPFLPPKIQIVETFSPPPPPKKTLTTAKIYSKYDQAWLENLGDWLFEPKISSEAWNGDYPYHERRRQKLMKSAKGIWRVGMFVAVMYFLFMIPFVVGLLVVEDADVSMRLLRTFITLVLSPIPVIIIFYVTHHLAAWYKFLAETILMQLNMENYEKRQATLLEILTSERK